jgi:ArsR family transcriptional regulator
MGTALARALAAAEAEDADFSLQVREDRQHLDAIRATREASAAEYFARHAADWDQLRSLHIADGPVEAALVALLDEAGAARPLGQLLDVGTGTGRMAELLAARRACHRAGQEPGNAAPGTHPLAGMPAGQVDLVQGDFLALPFADGAFDTVLFHQVLHYPRARSRAGRGRARDRAGRRIAVVDFAAHEREELRLPMPMRAWAFPMRRWPSCWAMPGSSRWPSRRWPAVN